MKKCPNENNIFTSKFKTSNTKKCEHCGVKVMALTIIIHCIQNSINLLTTRMIKVEDVGEVMVLHKQGVKFSTITWKLAR
jgi:hypothetical protein